MYCCFSINNVWDYGCMVQLQNTEMRLIKQVECEDPHEPLLNLFEATRGWFKGSRIDQITRLWIGYTWAASELFLKETRLGEVLLALKQEY